MRCLENDIARFCFESDDVQLLISRFCLMVQNNPVALEPFRGINENLNDLFSAENFRLYPTYKKTTLLYDMSTDCFIKILHPMTLKDKLCFYLQDKSESIYKLSDNLISKGIKIQKVLAYGFFKEGRKPFFVAKRAEGKSLYDVVVREKRTLTVTEYKTVIDEVAKLHSAGFWLADAHLSHIFMEHSRVSGFVDMDSIRKSRPWSVKNFAKDFAGLNNPELPLTKNEKNSLLYYYLNKRGIKNEKKFSKLVHYYTNRRWKDA